MGDATSTAAALLEMVDGEIPFDVYTANSIIAVLSKKGYADLAEYVLTRMAAAGLQPDVYSYTATLSAYARSSDAAKGTSEALLRRALNSGLKLTPEILHAAISVFRNDVAAAIQFWQNLPSICGSSYAKAVAHHVTVFEGLLRVCGAAGRPDLALRLVYALRKAQHKRAGFGTNFFNAFERGLRERSKTPQDSLNFIQRRYVEHLRVECHAFKMDLPVQKIRIKY